MRKFLKYVFNIERDCMKVYWMLFLVGIIGFSNVFATEEEDYVDVVKFALLSPQAVEGLGVESQALQLLDRTDTGTWTSEVVRSKMDFNAASLSLQCTIPENAKVLIEFRACNQESQWTEWYATTQLETDVQFAELNWAYQYRITLTANEQGQSPQIQGLSIAYNHLFEAMLSTESTLGNPSLRVAKPTIVSRAEWGARAPNGSYTNHTPQKITIHHTWRPTAAQYQGASTIRSIQNYHMDSNGWMDIGYHFLIGTSLSSGDTKIYQGRPETVVGAHTGGANTGNVGVNVIGDFTTETVHPNSYQALIRLLAWLCSRYGISPSKIYGHCDFNSTACPGQNLYSKMAQIRQDVQNYINSSR